ncbi:MAG: reverse transcriptase domain-containing protein, partial [bacterium]
AARLFYDDLNRTIQEDMKFKQNQYDPCVYNRIVGEDTITIRIHVDDLKVSCRSKKLLEETVDRLKKAYGEITVHYCDEHDYLGMVLSYNPQQKTITLNIRKYMEDLIHQFEQETVDEIK